jgi:hypothetical protein
LCEHPSTVTTRRSWGANPFVGLTRGQIAAALARVAQRAAVEPGAVLDELVAADTVGESRVDQEPDAAFPLL